VTDDLRDDEPEVSGEAAVRPEGELAPRMVGLDVGDKRIGVAITDGLGLTAQPLFTIHRQGRKGYLKAELKSIGRVLKKHGVTEVVVGNPLHMSGEVSPQALKAQAFAEAVRAEFGVTVHLWDERLTSMEAHEILDEAGYARGPERRRVIDQVAAVVILRGFLEARTNERARAGGGGSV
jgi:putative holliday junction resolvase